MLLIVLERWYLLALLPFGSELNRFACGGLSFPFIPYMSFKSLIQVSCIHWCSWASETAAVSTELNAFWSSTNTM